MKRSSKSDIPRDRSSRGHPGRPQFDLSNKQKFEGPFPVFQLPKLLGSFSLDKQRSYLHDSSQLRYICLPDKNGSLDNDSWKVRYDLTVGVEEAVEKDEDSLRNHMLDDLLTWILRERKQFEGVDIVCFRGLLTLIIASPYENNTAEKSWTLVATRYRKVIYLWQIKDDENEKKSFMRNPMQRHMCIWGFKFEQYLCAGTLPCHPFSFRNNNVFLSLTRFGGFRTGSQAEAGYQRRVLLRLENATRKSSLTVRSRNRCCEKELQTTLGQPAGLCRIENQSVH